MNDKVLEWVGEVAQLCSIASSSDSWPQQQADLLDEKSTRHFWHNDIRDLTAKLASYILTEVCKLFQQDDQLASLLHQLLMHL